MNTAKQALTDKALELHLNYKSSRVREMDLARIQAEARIQDALDERNTFFAMLVDDEGFSISDITRITDNKDWKTAREAVIAGRAARGMRAPVAPESEAAVEEHGPYVWNEETGVLSVTMDAEDFEPYAKMLARQPGADGEAWSFEYDGQRLVPSHQDDDATWEQPVVQVVMTEQGKKRAIAFIQSQSAAAA